MQIDRSNYEVWIIDWLDGNLNDFEIDQLHLFLSKNPDLKEELDELNSFRLNPDEQSFPYKTHLVKTAANLPKSQFEYLCIAYLEDDLSSDQQAELLESIEQDPKKKISFESIQKIKLSPVALTYKHKNRLLKRTVVQKVIRLSVVGLSVAAAIALIYLNYFLTPRILPDNSNNTAQNIVTDSTVKKQADLLTSVKTIKENPSIQIKKQTKNLIARSQITAIHIKNSTLNQTIQNDSLIRSADFPPTLLKKIPVSSEIGLIGETLNNTLIALNTKSTIPEYDDDRSRLSKFIAKTFRQKILREKTTKDSPLKGYEIAEAGVSGLNKLLGWEMALDKMNDENGELKSVYFSSKILKFNAPVKKSEPLP
jgi:hypothetical protein